MTPIMLAERYQLGELIAIGGMGSVYRAVDTHLGRPVAVKILKRVLAEDATFLERFRREARAAAAISHPGVAKVYDYGECSREPFMVMELVDGDTLAERIARHGRLPWERAFAVAEQVASALSAAHGHGVVHRDVKPANILIDRDGRVKVTDFGIARAAQATALTRPGMVLGSANYVAPEQAQGNPVGPAADLYSLGCVLYESIVGTTPYQGRSAVAIATQHVSSPVPDPREHVAELPEQAARLIMRSLGKRPGDRFPSASSMAAALAEARMGRDPSSPSQAPTVSLPLTRLSIPEPLPGPEPPMPSPEPPLPPEPPPIPEPPMPSPEPPVPGPPPGPGPPPVPWAGPSAVTTAPPLASPEPGWSGPWAGERGPERVSGAGAGGHTPPMPWARVPGDVTPAGAGPGGPVGRRASGGTLALRRSRRRATWLLGLALGLVALLALPLVVLKQSGDTGAPQPAVTSPPANRGGREGASLSTTRVRLPDLRGERLGVATARLRALDLEVVVLRGPGGGRRAVVVSMSPVPDSTVDRGSRVVLVGGRPGKGGDGSEEDN